jgi:hypothetical protein
MAVLADEANVSQEGKLNLMGIFDRIAAATFPVLHPRMVFAFRVEAEFGDAGRAFPVRVTLEDDEGGVLFEAAGDLMAPPVPPGEFATANQLFSLVGVQFPRAGMYRFIVQLGDLPPHETPLILHAAATANDPKLN